MPDFHDPIRHSESLSQAYAEDKRPLGFFLTAGCPFSIRINGNPLIPDMAGLTSSVEQGIPQGALRESFFRAKNALVADGIANPNIESILTFLRSLRQVAGCDHVRGFSASELENLDKAIGDQIMTQVHVTLPESMTSFDRLAMWIGSRRREFPVEIFTTNYDLLIEQALERARVPHFDGFVGSRNPFFDHQAIEDDQLPARWARLWKLHGSINWAIDRSGSAIRTVDPGSAEHPLIHPSHLKYTDTRRMPYLAMIDQMRAFLHRPSAALVVCGYSFNDAHLNEVLLQGVQSNPTAIIFALQYGGLASYPSAIKLSGSNSNFNTLAEDEAVIGTLRAPWRLPQSAGPSQEQWSVFWESIGQESEGRVPGKFLLGDFDQFGRFLALLVSTPGG